MPYASSIPGERNESFIAQYEEAYKRKPGKYAAAGYNALNILMEGIQRAGGTAP